MLGREEQKEEERKESFRNFLTSVSFLRASKDEQQNEINRMLAAGRISLDEWNQVKLLLERNLRVVSLNIGYNVMSNIIAGNEAPFVERCQRVYPKISRNKLDLSGWLIIEEGKAITNCAYNSAEFLTNYNLFALQEVNPNFQQAFASAITNLGRGKFRDPRDFEFADNNYRGIRANNTIIIGYDRNVMGQGLLITPRNYAFGDNPDDMGVLQAVYFPARNLLFVNLHAPQDIDDLEIHLDLAFEMVRVNLEAAWPSVTFRNLRVILAGDFNDCKGEILNYSNTDQFTILGRPLRLHVNPSQIEKRVFALNNVERTCCFPEYRCHGDYIFDSFPSESKLYYFGHPIDYQREVDLYSDHDPVIMLELDDFRNKTIQGEILRSPNDDEEEHIGIVFKNLDQDMLFDMARLYLRKQGIDWRITKPLSWRRPGGFPHVSLNKSTYDRLRLKIGDKVNVTLITLRDWERNRNRWVAIEVLIRGSFVCPGTCHISIGQQKIPADRNI